MKKFNFRKVAGIALILASAGGLSLLFLNATPVDDEIEQFVNSSKRFSQLIAAKGRSESGKQILIAHKHRISNFISVKIGAVSCAHLLSVDTSLISGFYKLFPKSKMKPVVYYCEVNKGRITVQKHVKDLDIVAQCAKTNSCINSKNLLSDAIVLKANGDFKRHDVGTANGTGWTVEDSGAKHTGKIVASGVSLELSPTYYTATFKFRTKTRSYIKDNRGNLASHSIKPTNNVFTIWLFDKGATGTTKIMEKFHLNVADSKALGGKLMVSMAFSTKGLKKPSDFDIYVHEYGNGKMTFEDVSISPDFPRIYAEVAAAIEKEQMKKTAITGRITRYVTEGANIYAEGFACLPGFKVNPLVRLYVGAASVWYLSGEAVTSHPAAEWMNTRCKNGIMNRFRIPLSEEQLKWFATNGWLVAQAIHPVTGQAVQLEQYLEVSKYFASYAKNVEKAKAKAKAKAQSKKNTYDPNRR